MRLRRESFLQELLADSAVYPFTKETAMLAAAKGEMFSAYSQGEQMAVPPTGRSSRP